MLEAGELGVDIKLPEPEVFLPGGREARQDGIRPLLAPLRVAQGLVSLHRQAHLHRLAEQVAPVVQPGAAVKVDVFGDFVAAVEIAVIVVVGHLAVVDAAGKVGIEAVQMGEFGFVTVAVRAATIVRQIFGFQAA